MAAKQRGMLVLEDGSVYVGDSMGSEGEAIGEIVFNTSMTGYQEIITDPSYWGQMVVFTCPHIGNVGVNHDDVESRGIFVRAVLARQLCDQPSNWRSEQTLPGYLRDGGVPALSGVDTRRLTLTIREKGVMRAALSTVELDERRLLEMALSAPDMSTLEPVMQVTLSEQAAWEEAIPPAWSRHRDDALLRRIPRIALIDYGVKHNILRNLRHTGAEVIVFPADVRAEDVLSEAPDGVVLSNGPGDPRQATDQIDAVKTLVGRIPMFGICLGHQIIALACGAEIHKLPFGHHGGNHPVQDLRTGEVAMTAQNHNYAVTPGSMDDLPIEVTHMNLYDDTIEGLRHLDLPLSSVQYHPEASPGPHDSLHLIEEFVRSLDHIGNGEG